MPSEANGDVGVPAREGRLKFERRRSVALQENDEVLAVFGPRA